MQPSKSKMFFRPHFPWKTQYIAKNHEKLTVSRGFCVRQPFRLTKMAEGEGFVRSGIPPRQNSDRCAWHRSRHVISAIPHLQAWKRGRFLRPRSGGLDETPTEHLLFSHENLLWGEIMKETDIRPLPTYILNQIRKADNKSHPNPDGHVRCYAYLTTWKNKLLIYLIVWNKAFPLFLPKNV